MKKTVSTLLLALTLVVGSTAATSCGVGGHTVVVRPSSRYVTQRVNLTYVNAITTSSSVDVIYHQTTGAPYAEIYAPDNVAPYIKVEQSGQQLNVGIRHKDGNGLSIQGKCDLEVRVYAPEVTSFTSQSSGDIHIKGPLKTSQRLRLSANSSGDIDALSIECGEADFRAQSSGDIEIEHLVCAGGHLKAASSGDCEVKRLTSNGNLSIGTGSSGDCKIERLDCAGTLSVHAASSGDCKIDQLHCSGDVTAETSSSADIYLSGTCRNADLSASSAGSIFAKDLQAVDVNASVSSAGSIECWPSGTLSTSVSSGGEIRYKGQPKNITGKIRGVRPL